MHDLAGDDVTHQHHRCERIIHPASERLQQDQDGGHGKAGDNNEQADGVRVH